jgi:FkbM family methyltransferase
MASEPPIEPPVSSAAPVPTVTFSVGSGGRKIDLVVPDEDGIRYVANEVFRDQCYKPVPGVPPPRAVLDIGANVGLAAAYFRLLYPDALIDCVEPDPETWKFLSLNGPRIGNCRLHQVGLYEGDCEKQFYAATNPVLSSLSRNPSAQATARSLMLRDAGRFVSGLGVERFDLIKIDTEGAELPIIRSLGNIVRNAATVYIEFHSREDRRAIDDLMNPSHCLFLGEIESAHRGHFTYVANALVTYPSWQAPLTLDR